MAVDLEEKVDLWALCTSDVILESRTGRMKTMEGLEVQSGIDKTIREGSVFVSYMGPEADAYDPTFHGGVDKAVHGCIVFTPHDLI
jgi:MOSC domain-containing protein YiiM